MRDISSPMTSEDEKVQLSSSLRIPAPPSHPKPSGVQHTNPASPPGCSQRTPNQAARSTARCPSSLLCQVILSQRAQAPDFMQLLNQPGLTDQPHPRSHLETSPCSPAALPAQVRFLVTMRKRSGHLSWFIQGKYKQMWDEAKRGIEHLPLRSAMEKVWGRFGGGVNKGPDPHRVTAQLLNRPCWRSAPAMICFSYH